MLPKAQPYFRPRLGLTPRAQGAGPARVSCGLSPSWAGGGAALRRVSCAPFAACRAHSAFLLLQGNDVTEEEDGLPTHEEGKRPGLLLPVTFLSGAFFQGDSRGRWGELVALLGGVPSGKGRLPDGIVKRAGTPGPRWPSPHFLGSAAALRARRPQKRPAAPRLPSRGRAPRLPSRCSFSAGAPRAAAARRLPPRGTRDRQLGSWFGLGLVTGTAHGTGEGSRWGGEGRGQRVRSSAPRRRVSCGWCGEVRPRRHLQLEECCF